MLGNCNAGQGQPVQVEIESKSKAVAWTLAAFDRLGNSVSNSLLLGVQSPR